MARPKKQRKTAPVEKPAADGKPPADGIPAPFPVPDITGPSAQELAAHGSEFLTQAILVQQKGDTPALPIHEDVMTPDAFAMREITMGLTMLGVGEVYSTRVQRLAAHLADIDVLACAYWTRHNQPPVGHRGPWLSHAEAAHRSEALIREAKTAGVRRLVWTSIANPGRDADLSYYQGKARVEEAVRRSGLSYGILRPACFFGPGSILLENVAWAVRHLPVFPLPAAAAPFHVRPIHVEDYAVLVAAAVHAPESFVRDAAGPDRVEFAALVRHLSKALGDLARARGRAPGTLRSQLVQFDPPSAAL